MFWFKVFFVVALALPAAAEDGVAVERYSGKQDQSWELIQNKLGGMKTKLDSQTNLVNNLVAEKAGLQKGEDVARKNNELKVQHQKLKEMIVEYNKLNDEYLTKFPERGLKHKRIYHRVKLKTLDSFEDDFTLRGRMNKLHGKILRQYPGAVPKTQTKRVKPEKSPAKTGSPSDSKDVTETIELKK